MGAGSFKFVSCKTDDYLEAEAKTEHYRKVSNVKYVKIISVPEGATRLAMLKTGEADIVMLGQEHLVGIKEHPNIRIEFAKWTNLNSLKFYDLAFPDKPSPLLDIRVRRAIAYSLDIESIIKNVFSGAGAAYGNIVAPYNPGYDPDLMPHPYDPEKAKKLLAEAGYPDGFETELNTNTTYRLQGQVVAANLSKVGIRCRTNVFEYGMFTRKVAAKQLYGLGIASGPYWVGRIHPGIGLASTFDRDNKWAYYVPEDIHKLYIQLKDHVTEEKLAPLCREITKISNETLPLIQLWSLFTPYGISDRVKNWQIPPGQLYPTGLEYLELRD